MPIDRCICHNISFKEIKRIVDDKSLESLQELQAENISSKKCKLCLPYVEALLKTGKTTFKPGSRLD